VAASVQEHDTEIIRANKPLQNEFTLFDLMPSMYIGNRIMSFFGYACRIKPRHFMPFEFLDHTGLKYLHFCGGVGGGTNGRATLTVILLECTTPSFASSEILRDA
jgi:hypothetical protein